MPRSLLVVLALVTLAACGGGGGGGSGSSPAPRTWDGARALTGAEDAPGGVASDGARVLFTTGRTQVGENAVRAVALDGEAVSRLAATTPAGLIPNGALAIDGDTLYVAGGSGIVRMPVGGGTAAVVVTGRPAQVDDVVVSGADLWWTTFQYGEPGRIEVAHMPKAGGPVEVAAVNVAGALNDPIPEGGGAALVASPKGVLRVRAGRPPEVVVSSDAAGGAVTRLVADAQRLYLLSTGSRSRLLAVPRTGGAPVVLAEGVDSTADLAVAGDQVVFFKAKGGPGGGSTLQAVTGTGGEPRTIANGVYPFGDLAVVGTDRVVFSADGKVWLATVRP